MSLDRAWVRRHAADIAARAPRELEALVGVSSPSGDMPGAEEAVAVAAALLPTAARIERPPCSSPDHAPDLLARLAGRGRGRILLLGHLDTVVPHAEHRALERRGERLHGSGTVDMKGGDVLALGVLRALAERPDAFAEAALLLVNDEEWRTGEMRHVARFAGFDGCLCFEAGALSGEQEAVVVERKAAGTLHVRAHGAFAHSGAAPERGRSALLALAATAQRVAAHHAPAEPGQLTAVPTILRSGEAFNVVPGAGELYCDLRARGLDAFDAVLRDIPGELDEVRLDARLIRRWPGMDSRAATAPALERASALAGRAVVAGARGGASDASHMATAIPLTVDGLGPRGGGAHAPDEHVLEPSIQGRAEIALALAAALLEEARAA